MQRFGAQMLVFVDLHRYSHMRHMQPKDSSNNKNQFVLANQEKEKRKKKHDLGCSKV